MGCAPATACPRGSRIRRDRALHEDPSQPSAGLSQTHAGICSTSTRASWWVLRCFGAAAPRGDRRLPAVRGSERREGTGRPRVGAAAHSGRMSKTSSAAAELVVVAPGRNAAPSDRAGVRQFQAESVVGCHGACGTSATKAPARPGFVASRSSRSRCRALILRRSHGRSWGVNRPRTPMVTTPDGQVRTSSASVTSTGAPTAWDRASGRFKETVTCAIFSMHATVLAIRSRAVPQILRLGRLGERGRPQSHATWTTISTSAALEARPSSVAQCTRDRGQRPRPRVFGCGQRQDGEPCEGAPLAAGHR